MQVESGVPSRSASRARAGRSPFFPAGPIHVGGPALGTLHLPTIGHSPRQKYASLPFQIPRSVSDPRDDLSGHAVAISSNDPGLRALLRRMAADLRLTPLDVPESGRRAYHAGASIAAGGLVSLASAAVSALVRAGVDERSATRALLPLMRSAIGGIERRGLRGALTGPIIRGDWEVVDQHLQALRSDLRNLYLSLAQQSLRLASPSLSSEATQALRRVLQAWRRLLKRRE